MATAPRKNKFWAGDSSSESEPEPTTTATSDVEEEEAPQRPTKSFYDESDEEVEEKKRVVKSMHDKLIEELASLQKSIGTHCRRDDPAHLTEDLEALSKWHSKAAVEWNKPGAAGKKKKKKGAAAAVFPPRLFVRCLAELEGFLDKQEGEEKEEEEEEAAAAAEGGESEEQQQQDKKKQKALLVLKQKVRKHNKAYEADIAKYKENPDVPQQQQEEEEDDEDKKKKKAEDEDEMFAPSKMSDEEEEDEESGRSKWTKKGANDSDEESEGGEEKPKKKGGFWATGSSDEGSDDEAVAGKKKAAAAVVDEEVSGLDKWRLKPEDLKKKQLAAASAKKHKLGEISDSEEEEDQFGKMSDDEEQQQPKKTEEGEEDEEEDEEDEEEEEKKKIKAPEDYTDEEMAQNVDEVLAAMGRKKKKDRRTDSFGAVMSRLSKFSELTKNNNVKLKVLMGLTTFYFNSTTTRGASGVMSIGAWKQCIALITKLVAFLTAEPKARLMIETTPVTTSAATIVAAPVTKKEDDVAPGKMVLDNLMLYTERLDDEYLKSLQGIDAYKPEFATRVADEVMLEDMEDLVYNYLQSVPNHGAIKATHIVRIAVRRIEHIYYRTASKYSALLRPLSALVFEHGTERNKARTAVCLVYNHAICNRFHDARDLLLRTHLQDGVSSMDVPTQILYNRATAQLGLCAFRKGLFQECHSLLSELYSSSAIRELLGQGGASRNMQQQLQQLYSQDDLYKMEQEEKRRLVPYHMQISLDLTEAAFLISAMLLEIPAAALATATGATVDPKRRALFRHFHRLLAYAEDQAFYGPPQSTRDYIVSASRALQTGEWHRCCEMVLSLPVWSQIQGYEPIKEALKKKIQEEAMRTYLLTYSTHYQSISLAHLSEMFELSAPVVHCLVSRMLMAEELLASFDQPTGALVPHHAAEPNRLQMMSLALADKVAMFVENNERLLDSRTGIYGFKDKDSGPAGSYNTGGAQGSWHAQPRQQQSSSTAQGQQRGGYKGGRRT